MLSKRYPGAIGSRLVERIPGVPLSHCKNIYNIRFSAVPKRAATRIGTARSVKIARIREQMTVLGGYGTRTGKPTIRLEAQREVTMAISDQIGAHLPYLRRYARALTGSQASGDAYVRATLEAAVADDDLRAEIAAGRAALYRAFTSMWASSSEDSHPAELAQGSTEKAAQDRLSAIAPLHRQALLLTTIEDFSSAEAGDVLGLSADDVDALVGQALAEIAIETATNVLIIEDEPLISMQLEGLVTDMGHTVSGTAATHRQAIAEFEKQPAGLVLADIQLADGSSGIEAVEELLKIGEVPVIFITAYPERLLTGERPEPTYLVTKPFREETVRVAISQALFFGSTRPTS